MCPWAGERKTTIMATKTIRAAIAAICVAAATFAEEPDAFLEYVESDGTQYIDTEIVGRCNTSADMTIQWLSQPDGSFLSSRLSGSGNGRFILCSNDKNKKYYSGHRAGYWGNEILYNTSGPDRIQTSITHDGTDATITMTINGNEATVTRTEDALDTELNMYLFAQNHGGTVELKSSVRCYSVKIWQDNVLVRDYKPCVKNNVAGLYDDVSKTIFYPAEGTLAAGPVLKLHATPDHFIQYVEATGTQYIDTEVVGRCGTSADMAILWIGGSDSSFLSSRVDANDTRFILCSNQRGASKHYYMAHRSYSRDRDVSSSTYSTTTPDRIVSSITHDGTNVKYTMSVNGTEELNVEREDAALDTNISMYIFAQNLGGSPTLHSQVRCFDLKITQDGTLVRDFRPCVKDGRAGLYDEVSGWIFFPQGGELVYPNETPDRYVRWANATGSSYVPVAVRGKSGVKAEMMFRPMDDTKVDQYFLAARNSLSTDTRFLLNYLYHKSSVSSCIAIGYKNKWQGRYWKPWTTGTDYTLSSEISSNGTLDGNLDGATTSMQTQSGAGGALGVFDTGLNLYMFAINMGGNAQDYFTGRFYYTKIWEWDETAGEYRIVRDLKPCVKDGNVMFFDEASHTMFKPYPAISAEGNVNKTGFIVVVK